MSYRDNKIFDLISEEFERQKKGLELIASENYVSPQVMEAMGTCLTNKYAEGLPYKRYYGGCEVVDEIETIAIERAKKLFSASWANVQPHSGAQANAAVFLATLKPGDNILGLDLSHGGHLTHGSKANLSGKYYVPNYYGVEKDTGLIDLNKVEDIAKKTNPKIIITGASAYSRDWNYKAFREIADKVNAVLMCDMAHTAGLISQKLLNDPLEYCDVVTSTTHKTLRGPRGGIILLRKDIDNPLGLKRKGKLRSYSSVLDSAVFPGTQGGPLEHIIASKAISFEECLQPYFKTYAKQVIKNANKLAESFVNLGYNIISKGTDNHLMLIDLRNKNLSGKEAEEILGKADITVNKNTVPFDERSAFVTSGIRIGTAAVTTRGLKENNMEKIADLINKVIENKEDNTIIEKIKKEVNNWSNSLEYFVY